MIKIRPEKNQIDNEYAKQICFCANVSNVSLNARCVFLILEFKYVSLNANLNLKWQERCRVKKTCEFGI